jgi:ABC-type sugar transport system permease subunit
LRLWNIPSKTSTHPLDVAKRRVFEAFCAAHPHIRVRALVPLRIEGPGAEGNEFLAVAGGVAPDVFYLYGRKIGDYHSQGFLLPLNDYLARYERTRGVPYVGVAAPDQVWELCVDKGQVVAVPISYYSMALLCDNAAFARRGLAGRFPRDWDELYEFARHLTFDPRREPGGNPNDPMTYGIAVATGLYAGWIYLQYVWSAGGDVVQSYLPKDGRLHRVPPPPLDYRALHIGLSNADDYAARVAACRENLGRYARVEPYSQGFTHVMTRELGMAIEAAFADRPDPATGTCRRDLQAVMSGIVRNRLIQAFNAWPAWLAAAVKIGTLAAVLAIVAALALQAAREQYSRRGRWLAGLAAGALLAGVVAVGIHLARAGGPAGLLGAFVRPFAFKEQAFLRDPDLALFWLIVPVIWAGAGPGCLIYLAALKGIPEEQYEAADLDGAGVWSKLTHITYPNLKALIIINVIGAVIGGFKESGNIFVMTGGGPEDATMTVGLYIWYNAFMFLNFGLSTAMAWIMGALLIGFTLTQLRVLNRLQFRNVAVDQKAGG